MCLFTETGIIHLYIIYYILEHESKIWVFKFFDSSIESTQNRHQAESIKILKHWLLDNINRPYVFIIFSNNLIIGIFISDKRSIQLVARPINKSQIAMFFRDIKGIDFLLNPKDYQNVPAAIKLVRIFANSKDSLESNTAKPMEADVSTEFALLAELSRLLLSFSTDPYMNLNEQLVDLSALAHLLFYIYRRNKNQVHDQQPLLWPTNYNKDAFIAAA